MSISRADFGVTFEMFVDSEKTFQLTVKDANGALEDITSTTTYATGRFKIVKPDLTLVADVPIVYSDRPASEIEFTITTAISILANAGNWIGEVEFVNITPVKIDEQRINFNILQSG